jgi:hypothetical protein
MKPSIPYPSTPSRAPNLAARLLICLLLVVLNQGIVRGQCPGGFTRATLNWDKLDFYFNNGTNTLPYGFSTGTYVRDAMEMTQKFALGPNYITLATNNAALINPGTSNGTSGENALHTGDVTVSVTSFTNVPYTGHDAQFNPSATGQTITITFNTEVHNPTFTLYDIDALQALQVTAAGSGTPTVNVTTQGGTQLVITGGAASRTITSLAAGDVATTSNTCTATIDVTGGLIKTITINVSTLGTSNTVFWLSDIHACVSGSFPANYQQTVGEPPYQGPGGIYNQADYFIVTPDNNSAYMLDPVTGRAWFLFTDPGKQFMNSFAYDAVNRFLYYIAENPAVDRNNKMIKRYRFNTNTIDTVTSDITTLLNIPTMNSGVESAGAAFYDGKLYIGFEGGSYNSSNTRESIVWRIDKPGNVRIYKCCTGMVR